MKGLIQPSDPDELVTPPEDLYSLGSLSESSLSGEGFVKTHRTKAVGRVGGVSFTGEVCPCPD